jgi:alpha-tubulin suppressor-like RCC1 family protein
MSSRMKLRTLAASALLLLSFAPAQAARRQPLPVIDAGINNSYVVKPDGTLWAWGFDIPHFQDSYGSSAPVQLGSDSDWLFVTGSGDHAVAIKQDGTLWAWGKNDHGQLGNGNHNDSAIPVQVVDRRTDLSPPNEWIAACAGQGFTAAIKADGLLYTWGNNDYGQLGNGTTTPHDYPDVIVYPNGASNAVLNIWKSITCGENDSEPYMLGLKYDGTLWAWGDGERGVIGNGASDGKLNPTLVGNKTDGTDGGWTAVSAGIYHVLGLRADGSLWAWGSGSFGELGQSPPRASNVPLRVTTPAKSWRAVGAGGGFSVALASDGHVYTWGTNSVGSLGDGTNNDHDTPFLLSTISNITQISAHSSHVLALGADGRVWTWGFENIVCGREGDIKSPGVALTYMGPGFVTGGYRHSGLITGDGKLWTTGEGASGKLGTGNTTNRSLPTPTKATSPADNWVQFGGGRAHSVALKADGTLWTAGNNDYGQLGRTGTNVTSFGRVGTDTKWTEVHAGYEFSLALKADGTLWGWGHNNYGQLGDNSTTNRATAVKVSAPATSTGIARYWVAACTGLTHSAGILSDGTLWTWGRNNYGQLGTKNNTDSHKPVQVVLDNYGSNRWSAVQCGENHTVALRNANNLVVGAEGSGTMWSWGRNHAGQLGNGNTTNSNAPIEVLRDHRFIAISLGSNSSHTVALDAYGTAHAWGLNTSGQLGDGTKTNSLVPVSQEGIRATGISAGANHTFARAAWDVYGWGQGGYGQLGCNNFHDSVWEMWCFGL